MRYHNALVGVAAVISWAVAGHLGLVALGMMTDREAVGPVCNDIDNSATACVIVVDRVDLRLADVAYRLREPLWRIMIDNPTAPLGWTLTPGTRIKVTRNYPAPPDEW
jgi:hypothetical protein